MNRKAFPYHIQLQRNNLKVNRMTLKTQRLSHFYMNGYVKEQLTFLS